jgi:hypothetical protein
MRLGGVYNKVDYSRVVVKNRTGFNSALRLLTLKTGI